MKTDKGKLTESGRKLKYGGIATAAAGVLLAASSVLFFWTGSANESNNSTVKEYYSRRGAISDLEKSVREHWRTLPASRLYARMDEMELARDYLINPRLFGEDSAEDKELSTRVNELLRARYENARLEPAFTAAQDSEAIRERAAVSGFGVGGVLVILGYVLYIAGQRRLEHAMTTQTGTQKSI